MAQSQRELLGGSQQERRQRQESTGRPKGTVGKPVIGLPLLGFCQAGRFVFPRLEPRLKGEIIKDLSLEKCLKGGGGWRWIW